MTDDEADLLAADLARARAEIARLQPDATRFDAVQAKDALVLGRCDHGGGTIPAQCGACIEIALTAAYKCGWVSAPNLDERNHRAAWEEVERLRAALNDAQAAIWDAHYGKGIAVAYVRAVDAKIRAALASAPTQPNCRDCNGTGKLSGAIEVYPCDACNGTGKTGGPDGR